MQIMKRKPIHASKLERWLGAKKIERLQRNMAGWHGPAINLRDVPGSVWITADGDFIGDFRRGAFGSALDVLADHLKQLYRRMDNERRIGEAIFGVGFTSISDALARASSGNSQLLNGGMISKAGPTSVAAVANTLWYGAGQPTAGAAGSAAPGGRACDKSTTGAMAFNNPASGTLHLVGADFSSSVTDNAVMLYDRIFDVAKTMNSTATESVTGVPTRYQSSTVTNADYAGGNFLFIEVVTALPATAHNWTVCLYRDEANNDAQTLPSVTGNSSAIIQRFDMPTNAWFCQLASGDTGIKDLNQMQCSAAVASGAITFVIGHPIGVMAFPVIRSLLPFDWLTNRLQAPRIFNDACLALFEFPHNSTAATVYNGMIYATSAAA